MIFYNPSGAPELACDQCGCRWFDRRDNNCCYECGSEVPADSIAEFQSALLDFAARVENRADATEGQISATGDGDE